MAPVLTNMRLTLRAIVCLISLLVGLGFGVPSGMAADLAQGAALFETHCAGCHINGGNIVRRGKTLQLKALERNQVNTLEAIAALVSNGKGNMSAYQTKLSAAEIQEVSAYVLDRAQHGWKS